MSGGLLEWCSDWFENSYYLECQVKGTVSNPSGPVDGTEKVVKGGSWKNFSDGCRTVYRTGYLPETRFEYIGLRLAYSGEITKDFLVV